MSADAGHVVCARCGTCARPARWDRGRVVASGACTVCGFTGGREIRRGDAAARVERRTREAGMEQGNRLRGGFGA